MSTKDENSMIGYDPLAWMHEAVDKKQAETMFEPEESQNADAWVELDDESEIESEQNGSVDNKSSDAEGLVSNSDMWVETGYENEVVTAPIQPIALDTLQNIEEETQAADAWVDLDDEPATEVEERGWVDSESSEAYTNGVNTLSSDEAGHENQSATGQTQFIVLNSVQNIQKVSQLHAKLLQALDCSHKIHIDASAVTQIDTATLQLLLVLQQTAMRQQKEVSIDSPSESFIETTKLLGLLEAFHV